MTLVSVLFWLMPVMATGFVIVHFRGKARTRRLEQEARERDLLGQARSTAIARAGAGVPARPPSASPPASGSIASGIERPRAHESASASSSPVRPRPLVEPPAALVFHLLKASLPECHVFVRVPMTDFFSGGHPYDVARMHGYVADFVVCTRTLEPMVIIELQYEGRRSPSCAELAARSDIRFVSLDPENLPRRDNVRTVLDIVAPL